MGHMWSSTVPPSQHRSNSITDLPLLQCFDGNNCPYVMLGRAEADNLPDRRGREEARPKRAPEVLSVQLVFSSNIPFRHGETTHICTHTCSPITHTITHTRELRPGIERYNKGTNIHSGTFHHLGWIISVITERAEREAERSLAEG